MTDQNVLTIDGRITSALTHFAGWGLLSVLEGCTGTRPRLRWTEEDHPRLQVASSLEAGELGAFIREHAERHANDDAWPAARVTDTSHTGTSLFSVRFKPPSKIEEWSEHFRQRDAFLDETAWGWRNQEDRFLTALGEPAWWRATEGRSADEGASRWEMKTRNRGEEFLSNRFVLLAATVGARTSEQILDGITGASRTDEMGKNSMESRSSTGFTVPGPTDNALAWCALWGISLFPLFRQSKEISQTAAVWPRTVTHPTQATLPVFTDWVTWAHGRAVVASRDFDTFATTAGDTTAPAEALRQQGLVAVVRNPIRKAGSSSAPERMLLEGSVDPL